MLAMQNISASHKQNIELGTYSLSTFLFALIDSIINANDRGFLRFISLAKNYL